MMLLLMMMATRRRPSRKRFGRCPTDKIKSGGIVNRGRRRRSVGRSIVIHRDSKGNGAAQHMQSRRVSYERTLRCRLPTHIQGRTTAHDRQGTQGRRLPPTEMRMEEVPNAGGAGEGGGGGGRSYRASSIGSSGALPAPGWRLGSRRSTSGGPCTSAAATTTKRELRLGWTEWTWPEARGTARRSAATTTTPTTSSNHRQQQQQQQQQHESESELLLLLLRRFATRGSPANGAPLIDQVRPGRFGAIAVRLGPDRRGSFRESTFAESACVAALTYRLHNSS
jgi:hypothetical protein